MRIMTSKMISVKEEVYKRLKLIKNADESFSDLLTRLIKNQEKEPLKHFGIAKDLPKDIIEDFEEAIISAKKEDIIQNDKRFKELWGE